MFFKPDSWIQSAEIHHFMLYLYLATYIKDFDKKLE